jgi:hypothetical protein
VSEAQSQAAPAPDYSSGLPPAVEVCSCEEALALRQQLGDLRRAHDTDAVTCEQALGRVDELERERDTLRALLRDVQYEHSRALIDLSPTLVRRIEERIGLHPREALRG